MPDVPLCYHCVNTIYHQAAQAKQGGSYDYSEEKKSCGWCGYHTHLVFHLPYEIKIVLSRGAMQN
jgi:hypothetical protein